MSTLKEQVVKMISSVEDEHLLELVKADIEYFSNNAHSSSSIISWL